MCLGTSVLCRVFWFWDNLNVLTISDNAPLYWHSEVVQLGLLFWNNELWIFSWIAPSTGTSSVGSALQVVVVCMMFHYLQQVCYLFSSSFSIPAFCSPVRFAAWKCMWTLMKAGNTWKVWQALCELRSWPNNPSHSDPDGSILEYRDS